MPALLRRWEFWGTGGGMLVAAAIAAVLVRPTSAKFPLQLVDATGRTGITFRHTDGSSGRRYIVETITAGVATFDYDGDGLIDIYFLNGAPHPDTPWDGPPPRNALYRNLGGFRFEDVTERAGVGDTGYGLGVAVGDYDNDGDPDLYVSNFGPKVLYRNNGDGTFTDVTRQAGVADGDQVGAGASFLDIDGDGDLDLYVANYVDFSYQTDTPKIYSGVHIYKGPIEFDPRRDTLFRNNGDGTFTDVSLQSGVGSYAGTGMGMVCADYDNDGDTDVFVLNDVFGNFCFRNDGQGRFEEVSLFNGLKYDGAGTPMASMGVDCADYDHDGWLDFFQTSYQDQLPVLYRNLGNGAFEDVTTQAGAGQGAIGNVKWGCGFADFDNDGHKDICYVFGHTQDNIHLLDATRTQEGTAVLLRNLGDGTFANVTPLAGDGMRVRLVGRGLALDDLDNDGRVDVVILNSRRPAVILRNESKTQNHWLQIELRGVKTNRDGVGARVKVVAGDLVQIDEKHSGRGYQSHFGSRLHFGLGGHDRAERIEVRWLGGGTDLFYDLQADQIITLVEGGRAIPGPTPIQ
ncbi:MAG: CRTAC1 family protein [Thermoguttaceae bacterium]